MTAIAPNCLIPETLANGSDSAVADCFDDHARARPVLEASVCKATDAVPMGVALTCRRMLVCVSADAYPGFRKGERNKKSGTR